MVNIDGNVSATTRKRGDIKLNNVKGIINASTKHGDIVIDKARTTVNAQTHAGSIDVRCPKFVSDASLNLTTKSGAITLRMPPTTNATIQAKTDKGTLHCEHKIAIKPYETTLDNKAWTRFKREVHGSLGTGKHRIALSSHRGSIKIVDDQPKDKRSRKKAVMA